MPLLWLTCLFIFLFSSCVGCTYAVAGVWRHLSGVHSLLLLCGTLGWNLGCKAWQQNSSPHRASHQPSFHSVKVNRELWVGRQLSEALLQGRGPKFDPRTQWAHCTGLGGGDGGSQLLWPVSQSSEKPWVNNRAGWVWWDIKESQHSGPDLSFRPVCLHIETLTQENNKNHGGWAGKMVDQAWGSTFNPRTHVAS